MKIIRGNKGVKTTLEAILRCAIAPIAWEEIKDKRVESSDRNLSVFDENPIRKMYHVVQSIDIVFYIGITASF